MSQRTRKANRHSSHRARAKAPLSAADPLDPAVASPVTPGAVSAAAPVEAPGAAVAAVDPAQGPGDEPVAAAPEPAPSAVPRLPGVGAEAMSLPAKGRANPQPFRCRLRDLHVVAADGSHPTRVLRAHVPFEVRLAFDLSRDANPAGSAVLCEVSVQARSLGAGGTSIVGQASECIPAATRTVNLRCNGLPLTEGLFRLEATAAVWGPGDARGTAFVNAGLIRVL